MIRKAKIVCTLGPSTKTREMIQALCDAGMDVARLNFSHGTEPEHRETIRLIREIERDTGRPIAILQDLSGPKIRTGRLRGSQPGSNQVMLQAGRTLVLTSADVAGTAARVHVTYPTLAAEVRPGDRILLSDGLIELRVESARAGEVRCVIVNGGELGERKGVNLPGVRLKTPAMTPKDFTDLQFGLAQGVDFVALSFVRSANDVRQLKAAITAAGSTTPVLAKLEKPEAIDCLDDILDACDGVMVARGDLGVEMAPEFVPMVQKRIIERAIARQKPVIIATQMLESMTVNPRPTRAEASDVAGAIFDGADAVMLSAETSAGRYPIESVRMMSRIIRDVESHGHPDSHQRLRRRPECASIEEAICDNVAHTTQVLPVRAIVVFTRSGQSARYISNRRPRPPIYAFCHSREVERRMRLYWGIEPREIPQDGNIDVVSAAAVALLRKQRLVRRGDIIAAIAGSPFGSSGSINVLKLTRVE